MRRKPAERLRRLDTGNNFSRWRARQGLHQDEAAAKLRLSLSQIESYERGRAIPKYATRVLMRIIDENAQIPEPWPE
jgi:transcriptional regulator with XRE-family HTH domain